MESLFARSDKSTWLKITIPTSHEFINQYHRWLHKRVRNVFKRDLERVPDSVQNVAVRLLCKDFIGRWFFKHLRDELVLRSDAEKMLGMGVGQLGRTKSLSPRVGDKSQEDSLWLVSDILDYASYDHDRYYYSIQDHTISSDMMLKLLGYPEGQYNSLKSLCMQGRLKPSEFTQHECCEETESQQPLTVDGVKLCCVPGCTNKHLSRGFCATHYSCKTTVECQICEKGRASLRARGLSLADDWTKSPSASTMRWLDTQLHPFLRDFRSKNTIKSVPRFIVRKADVETKYHGIEAGMLKYTSILLKNEVTNNFKYMRRVDPSFVAGASPGIGDDASVAWDDVRNDDASPKKRIPKETSDCFGTADIKLDLEKMMANLDEEERLVIATVDLAEESVQKCAESMGISTAQVHRIRNTAIGKMKNIGVGACSSFISQIKQSVCEKYDVSEGDLLGDKRVGSCVLARSEFLLSLNRFGLSVDEISVRIGMDRERVNSSIGRALLREQKG